MVAQSPPVVPFPANCARSPRRGCLGMAEDTRGKLSWLPTGSDHPLLVNGIPVPAERDGDACTAAIVSSIPATTRFLSWRRCPMAARSALRR